MNKYRLKLNNGDIYKILSEADLVEIVAWFTNSPQRSRRTEISVVEPGDIKGFWINENEISSIDQI